MTEAWQKNLAKASEKYQEKVLAGELIVPTPAEKAKMNPQSMRYAINAKCYDCCGDSRHEVRLCALKECSLWIFRPWQPKG